MPPKNKIYHRASGDPIKIDWYSRGYLPHISSLGACQFVTFRLYDSVPNHLIERWKAELVHNPDIKDRDFQLRKRIYEYEDRGMGQCFLRDHDCAAIVENQLKYYDTKLYHLLSWCIMPNHVHVLIQPTTNELIGHIVKRWKTFTARECNALLNRTGRFWMREYYDRYIRNEEHYYNTIRYIEGNRVMANLSRSPEEWKFGSARLRLDSGHK